MKSSDVAAVMRTLHRDADWPGGVTYEVDPVPAPADDPKSWRRGGYAVEAVDGRTSAWARVVLPADKVKGLAMLDRRDAVAWFDEQRRWLLWQLADRVRLELGIRGEV